MNTEAAIEELPTCLREVVEFSEDDEADLLRHILTSGWDQGCFLRLDGGAPLPDLSPERITSLLALVEGRSRVHLEGEVGDPFEEQPLAAQIPDDSTPGLVVISQRCDLIKPLAVEPLVEVAAATCSDDQSLLGGARSNSSAQYVHLADTEVDQGWVADMRTSGHIPKHWLAGREPAQLLAPGQARRRFAQRVGERHSRIPVPATLAQGVQRPLRDWLYKGAQRRALCAHFSDLLLLPVDDNAWSLIAIPGEGCDLRRAEDAFDTLFAQIAERVDTFPLSEDHSDVVPLEQLSMAAFHAAYRLDLANVTYGSKSASDEQADPAV